MHESVSESRDTGLLLGCLAFKVKALRNVLNSTNRRDRTHKNSCINDDRFHIAGQ